MCFQIALIGGLEQQHQQLLQQLPPELQAHHQTRHLAAALVPGAGLALYVIIAQILVQALTKWL